MNHGGYGTELQSRGQIAENIDENSVKMIDRNLESDKTSSKGENQ
jgi:hypothetical protein